MPSTEFLDAWANICMEDGDPKVDLYACFGKDTSYWETIGLAYTGGACIDGFKTSMNEWRKTPAEQGLVTTKLPFQDFKNDERSGLFFVHEFLLMYFYSILIQITLFRLLLMKWDTT